MIAAGIFVFVVFFYFAYSFYFLVIDCFCAKSSFSFNETSENKLNYELSMSFLTAPFDELLLEVKLESSGNETLFGII